MRTAAVTAWALVLVTSSAHAQVVDDDGLVPRRVEVTAGRASVTLAARYTFHVSGPMFSAGNTDTVRVPEHAVITGAVVRGPGYVKRLALDLADHAETELAALEERPGSPGHRSWAAQIATTLFDVQRASIAIAAPRDASLTIDIEVETPTCFVDDARHFKVPPAWKGRVRGAAPATTRAELDDLCHAMDDGVWMALPSRALANQPPGAARIGLIAARLALPGQQLVRVELDLAATLDEVPRDLHTVLLVDHSRSLGADARESQRALVAAYLREVPSSRVQVIAYARGPRVLLSGWTAASVAAARVDRELRGLAPRNGSNVDAGLAAAAAWLGKAHGTRRVIVFTDERLAQRLARAPATLRDLVSADTLVHAVNVLGDGQLARADDSVLAPLALATTGTAFARLGGIDGDLDARLLARPISLDNISIAGDSWQRIDVAEQIECPEAGDDLLEQGRSCVWWGASSSGGPITVTGMVTQA